MHRERHEKLALVFRFGASSDVWELVRRITNSYRSLLAPVLRGRSSAVDERITDNLKRPTVID